MQGLFYNAWTVFKCKDCTYSQHVEYARVWVGLAENCALRRQLVRRTKPSGVTRCSNVLVENEERRIKHAATYWLLACYSEDIRVLLQCCDWFADQF